MGSALSRVKKRFRKRLKNAQEAPAAPPSSSPTVHPPPALAGSTPAVPENDKAVSGLESVFPKIEPLPQILQRQPPFHSTPAVVSQESQNLLKTFRLRGINQEWDRNRVETQVKASFHLSDAAQVHICSFSPDPSNSERKIATLELTEMPNGITHASRPSEWMPHSKEDDLVLDTHFFGLTPLHETDDAKCILNVIAVPGLNGHAFGSFKAKSRGRTYMWLRDSLVKDLPHARIFIYGYGTELQGSNSFENIGDLALRLQHAINVVLKREHLTTVRDTVFIGHSLGGIVIKEALNNMFAARGTDRKNLNSVRGLLLFGVPNQGMAIESLIPIVNDQPNRQLVETLNENSDVLRHVTDDFITLFNCSHVKVICFYETEKSPTATQINGIWSMSGPPEILVDRHSATEKWQDKQDIKHPVKATHSGMVKFENRFEETYGTVLDHLRNFVEKAKVCIRELSVSENDCLKSLSFPTQDTRKGNIHTAHDTCDWLVRHPAYSLWLSAHRQLLWINGKPGAGKSTLMKYLCNTLMDDKSSDDYILASFFVHGQGDEMQRSKLGILRSLLHQILLQLPEHLSILTKTFVERESTRKGWTWSQEELMEVLRSIATQGHHANRPVIILVDALDELGEDLARDVVGFLGTLISHSPDAKVSTTSTDQTYIGMRICFSSRHFPDITPPDCLSICVENNNYKDIAKVVHEKLSVSRLSSTKEPEDPSLKELEGLIIRKADGVFQWVMLVVEQVLKPSAASKKAIVLQVMAEKLPSELQSLYSRILEKPSFETFQLLQWICFSRRPLMLFELRQALSLTSGRTYTSLEEYEKHFDYQLDEGKVHEMVKNLSCGLADVRRNFFDKRQRLFGGIVGFIHQSVQDYLRTDGLLQVARGCGIPGFLNPAKQDLAHLEALSNAQIAAACVKFLRSKEAQESLDLSGTGFYRNQQHLTLRDYARDNWLPHLRKSIIDDSLPAFLSELLLSSMGFLVPPLSSQYLQCECVPDLWSIYNRRHCCNIYSDILKDRLRQTCFDPGDTTMMHWLVITKSYPILTTLTKCPQSLDIRDRRGRTPLMAAILAADINAATLLLNSDQTNVTWKDEQHQTPLHHAATDLLSLDIFSSLLEKKTIECDDMDLDGNTPLLQCLKSRDSHSLSCSQYSVLGANILKAVQWLLGGGRVNPNQSDEKGNSLLAYAARHGHSAVVELLINRPDVEINARNKDGETAIFYAVTASQTIFTLLLENEHISLDLEDNSGRSVLSYAAELGTPQHVAKLVQKPNIGLNKQDNNLRTPLSYSVCRSGAITQILLDTNDVDPFVRDERGRSPVSYAATYRHTDAFERLWKLKTESNGWNEPDNRGRTPLSYAARSNPTAFRLLFDDSRIDRNQADCNGRTPISYAAQSNPTAFRLLFDDSRIDRNQADCDGRTLLSYAAERNPTAVRLLLDDSLVARNQVDCKGHTPLWYAVVNNNLEALRYLLSDHEVDKYPIARPILHKAVQSKDTVLSSLLIQAGWDVNMKNSTHRTPLSYVRDIETARVLLSTKGVDFKVKSNYGRTALFWIAGNGCPEVIRLLIEDYGFDGQVKDQSGLRPYHFAEDHETEKLLCGRFIPD